MKLNERWSHEDGRPPLPLPLPPPLLRPRPNSWYRRLGQRLRGLLTPQKLML